MRGDQMAKLISRERLESLKAQHVTQRAVAKAAGVSRNSIWRLSKLYGIHWEQHHPLHGNDAWKALAG